MIRANIQFFQLFKLIARSNLTYITNHKTSVFKFATGILLLLIPLFAQSEEPKLKLWDKNQLLEGKQMYCTLRDSQGFLWVGCTDGLLRFDGYKMQEFNASIGDSTQLQNDYVNNLFEDSKQNIWVLTQDFVGVFNYQTGHFKSFRIPYKSFASAFSILEDSQNQIWIATTEGYGQVSAKKGWLSYQETDTENISDIASGLSRFYQDKMGNVWLERSTHDLKTEIELPKMLGFPVGDSSNMPSLEAIRETQVHPSQAVRNEIYRDRKGGFWFFGLNFPLRYWNGKPDSKPITLVNNTCWKVTEDFEGNIWVASTREVYVWKNEKLPIQSNFIEPDRNIYTIAEDTDGTIWAGGPNGIYQYTSNAFGLIEKWTDGKVFSKGLVTTSVHHLLLDSKQRLWAGTRKGLHYYDREKQKFQHLNYPIDHNQNTTSDTSFIYSLLEVDGEIWVGTKAGIYRLDEENKCFKVENESILAVYCLAQDNDGQVWAGTGTGLFRVGKYSYEQYEADFSKANGLKDNTIMGIKDDGKGNLLLATLGAGLSKFNKGTETFQEFNKSANIISNNSYGTLLTDKGIWVSTLGGVSFLPNNRKRFINITKDNGMPLPELNQNAYFQSASGYLYFGGKGGLFRLHPDSISFNWGNKSPSILNWKVNYEPIDELAKARIFGAEYINQTQKINLAPEDKVLSFEMSVLNMFVPSQIKYAFRLIGYNDKWIEREADSRQVTYTNLPVGSYKLQVKATNEFGVWGKEIREIDIEVHPSFTQTLGFKLLVFLSIGGLITGLAYAFQRQRYLKKIRKMETQHQLQIERQRISRDLHDNIGAQLTNIATKLEITAYQAGKAQSGEAIQERIEKVGDEARITIGLLRETIWAIQQDSFTLNEFANKLQQHLERNISLPTTYQFNFQASELSESRSLNANQALNLFRIFQEAIQNILKHAKAKKVSVKLEVTQSGVNLAIQDDGLGMNLDSARQKVNHYGLKNMQARAQEIDGNIEIESGLGKGTLVKISL